MDGAHRFLQRAYLGGTISPVTSCLPLQVAHAAVALMDATVAAGGRPSDALEGLFIAACLRIAAANEGGYVPTPDEAAVLFGSNGAVLSSRQHTLSGFRLPTVASAHRAVLAALLAAHSLVMPLHGVQQAGHSTL